MKCKTCVCEKIVWNPFPYEVIIGNNLYNICGLFRIQIHRIMFNFISFIDDFSIYDYMYLIRCKNKAFKKFKVYKSEIGRQLEKDIKVMRFDRGDEYTLLNS